ncbi:precorrin-8X methylmutase [Afifella sp. IM 167]|uniref:precorrin-8X methylmutase n=1 Tax=Afifella sp. IM 167 TaxID=2033586 RepID=UPI001CCEB83E|nr:precorrin-8X methylmutase [Afifella sp. IM 167]MBZ8134978.1 precorrin-8X methylmutase [Afifella sp. IM 167]
MEYLRDGAEITRRSFAIIEAECDLAAVPADLKALAKRVVHSGGMPDLVGDLAWSEGAGAKARTALAAGAPILCDVAMVAAGIARKHLAAGNEIEVAVSQPDVAVLAKRLGTTRSAAGFSALKEKLGGAIAVIGNAPTALFHLLELAEDPALRPALVLGFPVGFVGAAESKAALIANSFAIPFVALRGRRGGSAMAAAALNALLIGEEAA